MLSSNFQWAKLGIPLPSLLCDPLTFVKKVRVKFLPPQPSPFIAPVLMSLLRSRMLFALGQLTVLGDSIVCGLIIELCKRCTLDV